MSVLALLLRRAEIVDTPDPSPHRCAGTMWRSCDVCHPDVERVYRIYANRALVMVFYRIFTYTYPVLSAGECKARGCWPHADITTCLLVLPRIQSFL